jgi:hypothetical protein
VPHGLFIRALKQDQADEVEIMMKQLMQNAICFLYEIYEAEIIPSECEEAMYVAQFISEVYSSNFCDLEDYQLMALNEDVDRETLIDQVRLYVHFCRHRKYLCSMPCTCHDPEDVYDDNRELGIAIAILVKLGDFLRFEAALVTASVYRHMRAFIRSPMNCSISRAIGLEILTCGEYYHSLQYKTADPDKLPLHNVPCDMVFHRIATRFDVPVLKVSPAHDFDSARQIAIAIDECKKRY